MDDIRQIADQLDADRREAAKEMTFEQRALAGIALFDLMAESMRVGIRMQHPEANPEVVEQMLVERLRMARRFEATV